MKVYTATLTGTAAVLALIALSCTKVSVEVPEEIESKKQPGPAAVDQC
jgi:hypothetical protein